MEYKVVKKSWLDEDGKETIRYYVKKKTILNLWHYTILKKENINKFAEGVMYLQVLILFGGLFAKMIYEVALFTFPVAVIVVTIDIIGTQLLKYLNRDEYYTIYDAEDAVKKEIKKKNYLSTSETVSVIKLENKNLTIEKD